MTAAPRIEGRGVVLRGFEEGDVAWVFEACQDEELQRWTLVPSPYTLEDARDFVLRVAPASWREEGFGGLAVVDPHDGRGLASVGVAAMDRSRGSGVAELGYWVAASARKRGVGSEALALLTAWTQEVLRLARCELHIEAENAASIATALRAGYHHEEPGSAWLPRRGEGTGVLLVAER